MLISDIRPRKMGRDVHDPALHDDPALLDKTARRDDPALLDKTARREETAADDL